MSISFICILALSACWQNCLTDAAGSVEGKQLLDLSGLLDGLGLDGLLKELLDGVENLVKKLIELLENLLVGLSVRSSKFKLSSSSVERMNEIQDVCKQMDSTLDKVEDKFKEEGIHNGVKKNLDAVREKIKTVEKAMQKMSGRKPSGGSGLLGWLLG